MIPLKLTIQGIYSYQKKEVIDFQKLTQSGLFGIFGVVGSGKSTILEAISYVLYKQVERLNQRDKIAYNLMNLKSNELYIEYEFLAGTTDERYKFVVKTSRKKNFEDIKTPEWLQYKWLEEDKEWIPVKIKAEEILDLNYDNFRRTIIIPQGKFQEFLQLGDTERTRMLKDIFNLNEYDLAGKISPLETENKEAILTTKTRYEQVSEVSQTLIEEKEQELLALGNEIKVKREELEQKKQEKITQEQTRALLEEFAEQKKAWEKLQKENGMWKQREKQVQEYETCVFQFRDLLENKTTHQSKRQQLLEEIQEKEKNYQQVRQQQQKQEAVFAKVQEEYQQKETWLQQAEELQKMVELHALEKEIQTLRERIVKGKPMLEKKKNEIESLTCVLNTHKESIREKRSEMPDLAVINKVSLWFTDRDNLLKDIQKLDQEIALHQKEIAGIHQQKIDFLKDEAEDLSEESRHTLSLEELLEVLDSQKEETEQEIGERQTHIERLIAQKKLKEFAQHLHDNPDEPCPLCGASEHPDIMEVAGVDNEIKNLREKSGEQQQRIKAMGKIQQKLRQWKTQIAEKEKSITSRQHKLTHEKNNLDLHQRKFTWKGFDQGDRSETDRLQSKAKRIEKEIGEEVKQQENDEKTLKKTEQEREQYRKAVEKLEREEIAKESGLASLYQQITLLNPEKYAAYSEKKIQAERDSYTQKHQQVVQAYQKLQEEITTLRKQEASLESALKIQKENRVEEENTLRTLEEKLRERLEKSTFASEETIQKILRQHVDTATEKAHIKAFTEQFTKTRELYENLAQKAQGKTYEQVAFTKLLVEIENLQNLTQNRQKEETRLEEQIKKLEKDLQLRQKLTAQLEQLELRAEDIGEMKRLFRSEGFVQYVSSVYLQNLCNLANERFYKLTRQRLKLEVSENNNFQVRDFLNDGQVRSVKTLSGGQTFQASLSLALALADSIQRFTKSSQNFFFLDEGFGSQDDQSLQIVFNTLASLRQENRIVGVISHVESLQDEIKVFLQIENDEDEGSSITKSWELQMT